MTDLSMPTRQSDTALPDTELPAAVALARHVLDAFGTVDHGSAAALGQAHSALTESLRILLRTVDQTIEQHHYDTTAAPKPEPIGPGCGAPATTLVEGYSPRDGRVHGSLDLTVHACDQHADQARDAWIGHLTPYTMGTPAGRRCGERYDYRTHGGAR